MEWPKDNQPASFHDLTEPIRKAIKFAYELKRKNENEDIPWKGLPKGRKELANTLSVEEIFTTENLFYSYHDQNRDALTEIIAVCAQLSFEQNRRMILKDIEMILKIIEITSGTKEHTDLIREYLK